MSRNGTGRTTPPWMILMRPAFSTTNMRDASFGACVMHKGFVKPLATSVVVTGTSAREEGQTSALETSAHVRIKLWIIGFSTRGGDERCVPWILSDRDQRGCSRRVPEPRETRRSAGFGLAS